MSYHIITVESPQAQLDCVKGQFLCITPEETKQLPLDDIAAIIVCCFSAKIELRLLTEAAKRGVGLIFCDTFTPTALLLPAQRSTDTALTRAWQKVPPDFLAAAWEKTLDAKCNNQGTLASHWIPQSITTRKILAQTGRHYPTKEATVSRLYWRVFREHLNLPNFYRKRGEGLPNHLLDYGYAVLLARILQFCFACGLDPTFGIGHAVMERSTPLAYDLMEPFRPLVDDRVATWLQQHPADEELTRAYKQHLLAFLQAPIPFNTKFLQAQTVMEYGIRSFRKCLLTQKLEAYTPWMATNSKWAGSS